MTERPTPELHDWKTAARTALLAALPVSEKHGHCWCNGPDHPGLARHTDTCPARIRERFEQALAAAGTERPSPPPDHKHAWEHIEKWHTQWCSVCGALGRVLPTTLGGNTPIEPKQAAAPPRPQEQTARDFYECGCEVNYHGGAETLNRLISLGFTRVGETFSRPLFEMTEEEQARTR